MRTNEFRTTTSGRMLQLLEHVPAVADQPDGWMVRVEGETAPEWRATSALATYEVETEDFLCCHVRVYGRLPEGTVTVHVPDGFVPLVPDAPVYTGPLCAASRHDGEDARCTCPVAE